MLAVHTHFICRPTTIQWSWLVFGLEIMLLMSTMLLTALFLCFICNMTAKYTNTK